MRQTRVSPSKHTSEDAARSWRLMTLGPSDWLFGFIRDLRQIRHKQLPRTSDERLHILVLDLSSTRVEHNSRVRAIRLAIFAAAELANMEARSPTIACIGIVGRHNNPLHISLFPATGTGFETERNELEFSFMLNSCLDIFEARAPSKGVGHDFGLLHALDERMAMYGWLTNTGIKIVIVVDMEGGPAERSKVTAGLGLKNGDLTPVGFPLPPAQVQEANFIAGVPGSPGYLCSLASKSILHTGRTRPETA